MDLRKLDALVAEKVMCWKCENHNCDGTRLIRCAACGKHGHGNCYGYEGNVGQIQISCYDAGHMPSYSTSIADAWQVIEKIRDDDFSMEENSTHWKVRFGIHWAGPESAPLAICLAALRSKGIDVSEWEK